MGGQKGLFAELDESISRNFKFSDDPTLMDNTGWVSPTALTFWNIILTIHCAAEKREGGRGGREMSRRWRKRNEAVCWWYDSFSSRQVHIYKSHIPYELLPLLPPRLTSTSSPRRRDCHRLICCTFFSFSWAWPNCQHTPDTIKVIHQ